ncbi:MAG: hypothetical protein MUF14_04035 [Hyphomonadaceae bacterium]|nr:hypothetical protein [Hyphomonadaceae bacterium]
MPDYSKILTVIATSTDAGQLRNFQANAQAKGVTVIAQAAFNRLLAILVDHPPGSLRPISGP